MDIDVALTISRATERLVCTLIGGLSIYLGYKLFYIVTSEKTSVELGKIKLQKVAPGVCFALFGAYIILSSILQPLTIANSKSSSEQLPATKSQVLNKPQDSFTLTSKYSYATGGAAFSTDEMKTKDRIQAISVVKSYIDKLNLERNVKDQISYGVFVRSLNKIIDLRTDLVNRTFGPGKMEWYLHIKSNINSNSALESKLSPQEISTYNDLKLLIEAD